TLLNKKKTRKLTIKTTGKHLNRRKKLKSLTPIPQSLLIVMPKLNSGGNLDMDTNKVEDKGVIRLTCKRAKLISIVFRDIEEVDTDENFWPKSPIGIIDVTLKDQI
ncbi:hypothetical protein Tsubulata_018519, partial [Turnera subulata]